MPSYLLRRYPIAIHLRQANVPAGEAQRVESDATAFSPPMDVCETEGGYEIRMELAGVDPKEINITITDDARRVIISGTRYPPVADNPRRHLNLEIQYGKFARTARLRQRVDAEAAKATYQQGFLLVEIPKLASQQQGRKVPIDSRQ